MDRIDSRFPVGVEQKRLRKDHVDGLWVAAGSLHNVAAVVAVLDVLVASNHSPRGQRDV
jgi:hypothetical protein